MKTHEHLVLYVFVPFIMIKHCCHLCLYLGLNLMLVSRPLIYVLFASCDFSLYVTFNSDVSISDKSPIDSM